jgi:hypothetical protein
MEIFMIDDSSLSQAIPPTYCYQYYYDYVELDRKLEEKRKMEDNRHHYSANWRKHCKIRYDDDDDDDDDDSKRYIPFSMPYSK